MILYRGKIYETDATVKLLDSLKDDINETIKNKNIDREKLLFAANRVASGVIDGKYDDIIASVGIDGAEAYVERAVRLLKYENAALLVKSGLPDVSPLPETDRILAPVGALLHIAAGNVDVLPAYSVLSGLLCGNVNVLKLPSQDNGVTIRIMSEMIEMLPEIADFIYVFDTPSSDVASMLKMAEAADRIVVWGSDEAVTAVRKLAPPNVGIVEWGHRISFCFVGEDYEKYPEKLEGLAEHVITTSQLFCSSCQRVYVNSPRKEAADEFCRHFLPFLNLARAKHPLTDKGAAAEAAIRKYAAGIEAVLSESGASGAPDMRYYPGNGCALCAKDDPELEISGFFGNLDVSALPVEELFYVLRDKKGYLQTASIIADEETAKRAGDVMIRAGVTRIVPPDKMSDTFIAEPHDGENELARYCRIVSRYRE